MSIQSRLQEVRENIDRLCAGCGRPAGEVILIAVTKTHPPESIQQAVDAGQFHFGENKIQELVSKMDRLDDRIQWHMIGALQTNKIKYMAGRVNWIHSVSRIRELNEIEKRASPYGRIINVLIQVNISGEEQKSGCSPDELPSLLEHAATLEQLKVRGLMGMASLTVDKEHIRSQFRALRQLRDTLRQHPDSRINLEHLSMGMSSDMQEAIEEGASMVRVGTAIFGERDLY